MDKIFLTEFNKALKSLGIRKTHTSPYWIGYYDGDGNKCRDLIVELSGVYTDENATDSSPEGIMEAIENIQRAFPFPKTLEEIKKIYPDLKKFKFKIRYGVELEETVDL